ncbi:MAG: hypothetical protein IJ618_02035 [Prevotella sp.]|nr:hypothetical protein [Prevotella sp.]
MTEFIEESVQKRFESLESLRSVSKEVFNIDEAFFRASLIRNTLHLLASTGHIKFENEDTKQAFFQSVDMLQLSLKDYLEDRAKAFQDGVQQVLDLTDAISKEVDVLASEVCNSKNNS